MSSVLVTLPVYNEQAFLYGSVHAVVDALDASGLNYKLAIAEDGSTDGTLTVMRRLQAELPDLIVRSNRSRRGRGWALRRLWTEIDADVYVFADADLAAGPGAILETVSAVRKGEDVATASRYCQGAKVHRPPLRQLISLAYNQLVRILFHEEIRDHQCGMKAFTRHAIKALLALSTEDSWAWDTEIMVLSTRLGLKVKEVPIEWTERRSRRTPLRRLLSDVFLHGRSLVRLKFRTLGENLGPSIRNLSAFGVVSLDAARTKGTDLAVPK